MATVRGSAIGASRLVGSLGTPTSTPIRKRGEGGWFTIPGLQDGERTLEEGVRGLDTLAKHAKDATVLDLGCAEGLIGQWFVEHGARQVDGLDASKLALDTGEKLAKGLPMTFQWADFNKPGTWPCMAPQYDIVLLLSVLHKLREPQVMLEYASLKALKWMAVRTPTLSLAHLNIPKQLARAGFEKVESELLGIWRPWLGIFRRCT